MATWDDTMGQIHACNVLCLIAMVNVTKYNCYLCANNQVGRPMAERKRIGKLLDCELEVLTDGGSTSETRGVAGAAAPQVDMGMGMKDMANAAERCISPCANAL